MTPCPFCKSVNHYASEDWGPGPWCLSMPDVFVAGTPLYLRVLAWGTSGPHSYPILNKKEKP
jgi:hypothetical protein